MYGLEVIFLRLSKGYCEPTTRAVLSGDSWVGVCGTMLQRPWDEQVGPSPDLVLAVSLAGELFPRSPMLALEKPPAA